MERPPEWRVDTTADFDKDYAELCARNARAAKVLPSWEFYLARLPYRYSWGWSELLDIPADDTRVTSYLDPHDETRYFAAVSIDERRHIVLLRWVASVPDDGS